MKILNEISSLSLTLPASFWRHLLISLISFATLAFSYKVHSIPRYLKLPWRFILVSNFLILPLFALWQPSVLFRITLPLIDRLLSILSLLWCTWAICKVDSEDKSPLEIWGVSLVLMILTTASLVIWLPFSQQRSFNNSLFNLTWILLSFVIILVGLADSVKGWTSKSRLIHLFFLAFLAGIFAELYFPQPGNLIGYYAYGELLGLLFFLAFTIERTFFEARVTNAALKKAQQAVETKDISPALASSMLSLGLDSDHNKMLESLTQSLSLYLMADICGLTRRSIPSVYQPLKIFDLIREDMVKTDPIPAEEVPGFVNADRTETALLQNKGGRLSPEQTAFLKASRYNQAGNLLYYPISSARHPQKYGLLCTSPYTNKVWGEGDLYKLNILKPKLQQLLEKADRMESPQAGSDPDALYQHEMKAGQLELQEQMEKATILLNNIREDKNRLLEERTQEVQLWAKRQQNLEDQVDALNAKLKGQDGAEESASTLEQEKHRLQDALHRNSSHLEQLKEALNAANAALEALQPESKENREFSNDAEAFNFVSPGKAAPLSLHDRLESEIRSNANLFARQGQTCISRVGKLPDLDYLQSVRLSRILEQMQRNACAASPNYAEIKVEVSSGEPEGKSETIEISVTDSGGGLSPADLQQFLKYISCTAYPVPVGIGDASALREALELVKSSGGHLWVNNPTPNSTAYRILLPAQAEKWENEFRA